MTKTKGSKVGMKSRGAVIHDMTRKKNVSISPSNGLKPGLQTAAPAPAVKTNLISLALNANKR